MEGNDVAKDGDPQPVKEPELNNPVKDVNDTGALTFHPFPKLPLEVRDMVWSYGIYLTTSPSIVHINSESPNCPLLTHVCHEARAACLKRYSAFRHAWIVPQLQDEPEELKNKILKSFPKGLTFVTWVDFERDIFFMHDVLSTSEDSSELDKSIRRLYKHRLTFVKKLALSLHTANDLVSEYCDFWQTLPVLCPKITEITIFTNGNSFRDGYYDFSTACRDIQRITKKTMDVALNDNPFYDGLKSSLTNCDALTYEVGFAKLELDKMPTKPEVPKPKAQQLGLKQYEEIADEFVLSQWIFQ
ncbi:hypothetical protein NHQ30_001602 [Ciborinia camelliae]|nr:hypothetical protein NHQ30_001602 [Ciborinia camelliae]